ncbi:MULTISPECIES: universal stress protein [Salinirubellus]|uniref:universal stress protein n=1 Tax=Salinirubellus TaxID=2162630 RepID=UPI0030CBCB18
MTTEVDVGEPWRAIVEYAERNDIDHIIMGSHGRDDDSPLPWGVSPRQSCGGRLSSSPLSGRYSSSKISSNTGPLFSG